MDLIKAEKWDEAEQQCQELADRWPGQVDGIARLALVRRAQGRYREAAELFTQAAEFARTHEGFDQDSVRAFEDDAAKAEASAS